MQALHRRAYIANIQRAQRQACPQRPKSCTGPVLEKSWQALLSARRLQEGVESTKTRSQRPGGSHWSFS